MERIYSHCLIRLNISKDNKHVGFNSLKKTILQISVTSEQRSHSDPTASKKIQIIKARVDDYKYLHSNALASPVDPVGPHRLPTDGAHFEHAQNKRHGSAWQRHSKRAKLVRRMVTRTAQ